MKTLLGGTSRLELDEQSDVHGVWKLGGTTEATIVFIKDFDQPIVCIPKQRLASPIRPTAIIYCRVVLMNM